MSTKQGFENTYLKSGFNKYEALRKTYNSQRKAFLNSGSKDNSELRLLHARLWKMYKKFSSKEIEKYNPATPEPYPFYKTKAEQKSEDNLKNIKVYEDKKPSSSRIKTNNKVAKKIIIATFFSLGLILEIGVTCVASTLRVQIYQP